MAYKKYVPQRNPTFERKPNATLEGVYVERREVFTDNGQANLYTIEQAGGSKIDMWGDKMTDDFFKNMMIGTMVKVTYLGKEKTKKGGKTYHSYTFEYDDSTVSPEEMAKKEFGI